MIACRLLSQRACDGVGRRRMTNCLMTKRDWTAIRRLSAALRRHVPLRFPSTTRMFSLSTAALYVKDPGVRDNLDSVVAAIAPPTSELAGLGLGGNTPIGFVQSALEWVHLQSGLPWWLSIVATTVALRMAMLPMVVHLQKNAARMAMAQPELMAASKRMTLYRKTGDNVALSKEALHMHAIYQKYNCNPLKLFAMPLMQMPVFVSFFLALRRMATAPMDSMHTGGALWFSDLTLPDPFYALPLLACLSFLSNVELGGEISGPTNPTHKKMKLFLRASAVLILPLTVTFPSAMFMYWVTNSLFSTVTILALKVPQVKMALGIPIVKTQQKK